jgi:DNA processing protein
MADVLSDRERRDWLRLSRSENVGPASFRVLMQRYGSAGKALEVRRASRSARPSLSRRSS